MFTRYVFVLISTSPYIFTVWFLHTTHTPWKYFGCFVGILAFCLSSLPTPKFQDVRNPILFTEKCSINVSGTQACSDSLLHPRCYSGRGGPRARGLGEDAESRRGDAPETVQHTGLSSKPSSSYTVSAGARPLKGRAATRLGKVHAAGSLWSWSLRASSPRPPPLTPTARAPARRAFSSLHLVSLPAAASGLERP